MKKEDLFEALEDIDAESVKKARAYKGHKKTLWTKFVAVAACAAIVITAIWAVPMLRNRNQDQTDGEIADTGESSSNEGNTQNPRRENFPGTMTVLAAYPEPVAVSMSGQEFMESEAHWDWMSANLEMVKETKELQTGLTDYNAALMEKLLVSENENTVFSPLNTYIAFAMLAEVSEGNTRQQILDMLGASDIETLRENVNSLWNSNYADTPVLKSILANSIWLDNSVRYNGDTLNVLANNYYASSFSGTPGSAEMDGALRNWTDDNTGGLLKDYTKDMKIAPDTILEILSTIYYKAMWTDDFYDQVTAPETFHGTNGDTTVDMMHKTEMAAVFRTDNFTAVGRGLTDSGSMYFFLPNEGVDVNNLASDSDVLRVMQYDPDSNEWSYPEVNLSIPKFKVTGKIDLLDALSELGVTDALVPGIADFTPLTTERDDLFLDKAEHAAMVEIDEQGVTGAAYTELAVDEGAVEPDEIIDFVLDRPFMFMVTGRDGSVLFAGIVRNID